MGILSWFKRNFSTKETIPERNLPTGPRLEQLPVEPPVVETTIVPPEPTKEKKPRKPRAPRKKKPTTT